jgi:acyl-homoserine-lactone acylase
MLPRSLLILIVAIGAAAQGYRADIRRTSHGIPHIQASDLGSLGFGEGYAHAEDHLCSVADQVVRFRGERARFFGPGRDNEHIANDLAMRALRLQDDAAAALGAQSLEVSEWYRGYAAGYNHYLAKTGKDNVSGWCRGADWVAPVTAVDIATVLRGLVLALPQFARAMVDATPPGSDTAPRASTFEWPEAVHASNGWAIGRDRSAGRMGMLLANPHYPWVGASRFWEKHLTIPGRLNVYGVSLIGAPGVAIGFNDNVAWTHTVSAGTRMVFYALDLVPGKPTTYRYNGRERDMEARQVRIDVKQPDGSLKPVERTMWFSHYGPVLSMGTSFRWTPERVLTVRDANVSVNRTAEQWLAMGRSRSLKDFQIAHSAHQSLPWVNTIAAGKEGTAWYIDASSTPNLSPEALEAWVRYRTTDPWSRSMWNNRQAVLLDGGDPKFEWNSLVPFARLPQTERADYVFNANDSYWMPNSKALISGEYSPLHGPAGMRSLRTQNNDLTLSNLTPDKPAGEDGRFTLDELGEAVLGNRGLAAERLRAELAARCSAAEDADLKEACAALAKWDGRYNLDSRGAVLFREWLLSFSTAEEFFRVPWAAGDPVGTPKGLAEGEAVLKNLKRAVATLRGLKLPLDVPLGALQYANKPGPRIPIHGGHHLEGVMNMVHGGLTPSTLETVEQFQPVKGSRWLSDKGYIVNHGTSFLMALEFTEAGPRAKALLTYSQSGDPASPQFRDQTEMFSRKQWRPVLFREADIVRDIQRSYTVTGPRGFQPAPVKLPLPEP